MITAAAFPLTHRFRLLLYLLVLSSVATFANTESDFTPLFLSAVAAIIAWLLTDSPQARAWSEAATHPGPATPSATDAFMRFFLRTAPIVIPNVAVLFAAFRLAWRVYQYINGTQSLIVGLSGFIVALLLCKLFEPKSLRNIPQIMILSLLLVISATMFSNSSLFYFVLLTVFFLLLLYLVVLLNLMAETQRLCADMPANVLGNAPNAAATHNPGNALHARLSRDLGTVAKHCAFLVLPVTLMVFLLVPRSRGNPLLSSSWGLGTTQTGFSDIVQFRDYGQLSLSDTPVMKVRLYRNGQEVGSEFSDLYFRGQVLNEYDDTRHIWSHRSSEHKGEIPEISEANSIVVNYTLLLPSGRTLFLLSPSAPYGDWEPYTYNSSEMTLQDSVSRARGQAPFSYKAFWVPQAPVSNNDDIHIEPPGLLRQSLYGSVIVSPQLTAKAREILAASLGKDAPSAGAPIPPSQILPVVHIFESYLRLNYSYSLSFHPRDPKLDYTTDFVLNRGIKGDNAGGHCEYFASAMVMLCRAVGLNARMVTGYHGGEYDTVAHEFIIRQKYAHAWAEVNIPEEGWVLSDPSPIGNNLDTAAASGHLFKDLLQILESIWTATFVNFDNDSRHAIAAWFTVEFSALLDLSPFPLWTSFLLWVSFVSLIFLFIYLRRRFARLRPLLESTQGLPHRQLRLSTHVTFLEDLLHVFERGGAEGVGGGGGILRRPDQTPLEFLEPHCAKLEPAVAQDVRWLIDTAYGVRFGDTHLNPALKHKIALALKHVKAALRAPHPSRSHT